MDSESYEELKKTIEQFNASDGIDMNELVMLPEELSKLLSWMVRKKEFSSEDLSIHLDLNEANTYSIIDSLTTKKLIEEIQSAPRTKYRLLIRSTRKAKKYRVPKDIWDAFD